MKGSSSSMRILDNPIVLNKNSQPLEVAQDEDKNIELVLEVVEEETTHSPSA
jgi:hypothetical protein